MGLNQRLAASVPVEARDQVGTEPRFETLDIDDLRGRQSAIAPEECHVVLDNVSYEFQVKRMRRVLLSELSLGIPRGRKITLLGHKGVGKSKFLEIIGKKIPPSRGRVIQNGTVSWPLNSVPFFIQVLSVRDNLIYSARVILLRTPRQVIERVVYFAELDPGELERPMASLPETKRRRVGLALGLMAEFDLHLYDGYFRAQTFGFDAASSDSFFELILRNDYLYSLPNSRNIPGNCNLLYILYQGRLYMFDDIDLGKRVFEALPEPTESSTEGGMGDVERGPGPNLEAF